MASGRIEKRFHAKSNEETAGVVIIISDKKDIQAKTMARNKKGCHVLLKGLI